MTLDKSRPGKFAIKIGFSKEHIVLFRLLSPAFVVMVGIGCAQAPTPAAAPASAPVAPVPAPEPTKSEALAKADALIEEMRRNQVAFEKADREAPKAPAPRLEDLMRPATPTRATATPQGATTPSYVAPTPTASVASQTGDTRDEQWWKSQARTLQDKIEDETRRMTAARIAMQNSTLKITADEAEREYLALVAAVRNSQAALDRHRDDARRAGVPAGWARWP